MPHQPSLALPAQPLGFLPTRAFWRNPEHQRRTQPLLPIAAATLVIAVVLADLPRWALWATIAIPPVVLILGLGLFERHIRRRGEAASVDGS